MKYAVVVNSNGAFSIKSEWDNDLSGARVDFWNNCKVYENAQDVNRAVIALMNENWDVVEDKKEFINHTEPEPNEG